MVGDKLLLLPLNLEAGRKEVINPLLHYLQVRKTYLAHVWLADHSPCKTQGAT